MFHWTGANTPFRQAAQWVDQAFESARPLVQLERGTSLPSPQSLAGFDLVVVDGLSQASAGALSLVAQFVEGGGSVLVVPDSAGVGVAPMCEALGLTKPSGWNVESGRVGEVTWTHPFYRGVFRSVPSKVDWPTYDRVMNRTPGSREEVLIEAANGASYLSLIRGTQGRGDVYLLARASRQATSCAMVCLSPHCSGWRNLSTCRSEAVSSGPRPSHDARSGARRHACS